MTFGDDQPAELDHLARTEAAISARIDRAVAVADFSNVPLPDFTESTPNSYRVLADLAATAGTAGATHDRLASLLSDLNITDTDKTP